VVWHLDAFLIVPGIGVLVTFGVFTPVMEWIFIHEMEGRVNTSYFQREADNGRFILLNLKWKAWIV
jgi:hypothetical protein